MHGGDDYTGTSSVSLVLNPRLSFDRLQFIEADPVLSDTSIRFCFLKYKLQVSFPSQQNAFLFKIRSRAHCTCLVIKNMLC